MHVGLIASLAAVCLATIGAPTATASVQIKNGRIAYFDGQVKQIFSRNLDGSDVTQLTSPPGEAAQPAFSPDGETIAYERTNPDAGIWAMDSDGSSKRPLAVGTADQEDPAWSLDGSRIAYERSSSQRAFEIWVMDADGSNPHQVTSDPSIGKYEPTYSPDGVHIAYSTTEVNGDVLTNGLFSEDLTNGNTTRLTKEVFDQGHQVPGAQQQLTDESPTYSPDGRLIAFDRCGFWGDYRAPRCRIFVVDSNGGGERALTPEKLDGYYLDATDPAWSADGAEVVFSAYVGERTVVPPGPPRYGPYLFTIAPDGSDLTALPQSQGGTSPVWQAHIVRRTGCHGQGHFVAGTVGPNLLRGSAHKDVIDAQGGSDRVRGLRGADTLCGGKGPDRLVGGPGPDTLIGGPGRDVLIGGPGKDRIIKGPGDVVHP